MKSLSRASDLLYLGLDTSAYTTALALVDQNENLRYERRLPLPVRQGGLGLRQSEAVFAHINNMPALWADGLEQVNGLKLAAVCFSDRPRPVEKSYMPVFKVSEAFGLFLARTIGLDYFCASHQEGHIMAGFWSAALESGRYLVLHLSGGTTEILAAEEYAPGRLKVELQGGSQDLNAGQFIDRLGLKMKLPFPAGPALEALARQADNNVPKLPIAVKGGSFSFSGPASQAERLLGIEMKTENLARAIEMCIADSLIIAVENLWTKDRGYKGLLAVGGVAANNFIRERINNYFSGKKIYFTRPEHASDNAIGQALIASRRAQNG